MPWTGEGGQPCLYVCLCLPRHPSPNPRLSPSPYSPRAGDGSTHRIDVGNDANVADVLDAGLVVGVVRRVCARTSHGQRRRGQSARQQQQQSALAAMTAADGEGDAAQHLFFVCFWTSSTANLDCSHNFSTVKTALNQSAQRAARGRHSAKVIWTSEEDGLHLGSPDQEPQKKTIIQ